MSHLLEEAAVRKRLAFQQAERSLQVSILVLQHGTGDYDSELSDDSLHHFCDGGLWIFQIMCLFQHCYIVVNLVPKARYLGPAACGRYC